jgi:hypothetical protein
MLGKGNICSRKPESLHLLAGETSLLDFRSVQKKITVKTENSIHLFVSVLKFVVSHCIWSMVCTVYLLELLRNFC